ncbi:Small GTPase like protein [Aduncisulcus paluster]|uniref:Small GTPase like protein n=1 Tax=Aduncisulcus paluster TaxID=2918883 RepID=A0ABQ5KJG6_9EUKA|nr:Small GTPase like protein [Aduncisulcus paluster]
MGGSYEGRQSLLQHIAGGSVDGAKIREYLTSYGNAKFSIWDTASQKVFYGVLHLTFQRANVVMISFDISDHESFLAAKDLYEMVKSDKTKKDKKIVIVGTKSDCHYFDSENRFQPAEKFSYKKRILYFEVNPITGEGVDEMFAIIADACVDGNWKKFLHRKCCLLW